MILKKTLSKFFWIFLVCLILLPAKSDAAKQKPIATSGILDLQGWDFNADGSVLLSGDWAFYWNQIITPDSLSHFENVKSYRTFDKLWNDSSPEEQVLSPNGFATYHLVIMMDENTPDLTFTIPDFYSAYDLYLNGVLFAKNGKVGQSKESSDPHWLPLTINLPKIDGRMELVLHISNFRHSKGGASRNIILGERGEMNMAYHKDAAMDLILSGCLIMTAFFFLGLYWFGKQEMQLLFFGLYSLMYTYRIFGFGIYTLHTLFPNIPWIVTLRLEYLTLFLSSLFFVCYTYELYKEETSKIFVRVASIMCVLFSVVALVFPPSIFTQLVGPFFIILLAGFIYIIYTYVLAVYNKRTGSGLSLIGTSIVMIVFGFNILVYFGITPEQRVLGYIGYFIFFFIQSVILFNIHTNKLQTAKTRAETISTSKTEFLSTISHEMRTPLNAVIGLTNYLINDNPKEAHLADLKNLKHSADNLNFLINDVLDYSKIEAGQIVFDYTNVNIHELVENQIKSFEQKAVEKGISLTFDIEPGIPKMIVCDGFRLSQVLTNLLGNAIKFTSHGGVSLTLTKTFLTQTSVSIKFSIQDTGIGIASDSQGMIFDNYIQASSTTEREFGGTGLGLSITKKILELQNTKIHVNSILGKGSEFYFIQEFDISWMREAPQNIAHKEQETFEGKIVLLVEDNPVNVMIETKFLAKWGILVDVAENGQLAIEKAKASIYDLILMDLRMPVMNGYEATKELRQMGIDVPIIALTASRISKVSEEIFDAGMNDFIKKPFDPEEMYTKIKKHLSKSGEPGDPTTIEG